MYAIYVSTDKSNYDNRSKQIYFINVPVPIYISNVSLVINDD